MILYPILCVALLLGYVVRTTVRDEWDQPADWGDLWFVLTEAALVVLWMTS